MAVLSLVAPRILDVLIDGEVVGCRGRVAQDETAAVFADCRRAHAWLRGASAGGGGSGAAASLQSMTQRTVDVGSFWGARGDVGGDGRQLDGSDSPFAKVSVGPGQLGWHRCVYEPLLPLVHDVDAALDDEIHGLFRRTVGQLQGVTMTEQVKDKSLFCVAVPRWVRHFFCRSSARQRVAAVVDVTRTEPT